jgi:SAM-dependent methyltransferase
MACKVCRSVNISRLFPVNGHDIWRCADCGFAQVFISPEEIKAFYDEGYFRGEKAHFDQEENVQASPALAYWLERQLAPFAKDAPLRILEIGPGLGGQFGHYLGKFRPTASYEAVEISDFASDRLRARGLTVHTGKVSDPEVLEKCAGRFDLIIGTEVIEHDPDPRPFAESVFKMLRPGGRCAFTTGNLDGMMARLKKERWYYFDPPAHVSYYAPRSARRLFREAGFRDVGIWKVGINYIDLKLKTRLPGILFLADLFSLPTGMVINATR